MSVKTKTRFHFEGIEIVHQTSDSVIERSSMEVRVCVIPNQHNHDIGMTLERLEEFHNRLGDFIELLVERQAEEKPTVYDSDGYDRDGYDRDGYDRDGYDRDEFDSDGFNSSGYNSEGYDSDGLDKDAF